jgi:hypothetical protein
MPLPFSHYCVVDFETYYDSEYSLRNKNLSMTDYIRHELFEAISVAVWHSTWDTPKVAAGPDVGPLLRSINWNETAFCAHHAQFDGLILTHHYDLHPVFWLDHPVHVADAVRRGRVAQPGRCQPALRVRGQGQGAGPWSR